MSDRMMRELVTYTLEECVKERLLSAKEEEESATRRGVKAAVAEKHMQRAAQHRRQAAHYQQAIDLLEAASMPPQDEPR
jgi:DNA-binding FrmR family transcriptional regulator